MWQDRKRQWLSYGIQSELGRGDDGENRLTLVTGNRAIEELDEVSRKILKAGSGTSIFDPVLCELAYRWFSAPGGVVLDPFAGGSVRGLIASMLGRHYIGNDLRAEQIAANKAQAKDFAARGLIGDGGDTVGTDDPTALTPVIDTGGVWIKRDDSFAVGSSAGGKVRSCLALATAPGVTGLVTAGSRQSPQVNIVATIARHLGLPCRVHVPASAERTPELQAAAAAGAEIVEHSPGYNNVIIARARDDAAARGWTNIPFGMECQAAIDATSAQVGNIPADARRLVIPVGSGMSLAGVLHGLRRTGRGDLPVVGVVVGADPTKRLNKWAPKGWQDQVTLVTSELDYHDHAAVTEYGGVVLDPVYEAKCLPYLCEGDVLWVVGIRGTSRPTATPVPSWSVGDSAVWVDTLAPVSADLVFTCPPYLWLEKYSDDPADLSNASEGEFERAYGAIIAGCARALRDNRFAVFVVGDVRDSKGRLIDFRGMTVRAFESAGLSLASAAVLVKPASSLALRAARSFEATRTLGRTHQDVLVFVKGSRQEATKACGPVEVEVPPEDPDGTDDE